METNAASTIMNPSKRNSTFKSILAVFTGFITVVILSIGTDLFLETIGIFPPPQQGIFNTWMLFLAFFYRSVYTIAAGYATAALSPQRPKFHVFILGIIGTAAGSIGAAVGWNLSAHWYPIALAVTAFPFTWLGGKLKSR